jgi:hypothetical protein
MLFEAVIFWALGAPADPGPDNLPPLMDLRRWPGGGECREQLQRCRAHREQLQLRRWIHGYGDGRLDAWLAQTDHCIRVWQLLERAQACEFGHGDDWNRSQLLRLRELIGADAYREGWRPPLLPEPPPATPPTITRVEPV